MQHVHALRQSHIQFREAPGAVSAEHGFDLAPANVQVRVMVHRFSFLRHGDHELNARPVAGKTIAAGDRSVAPEAPAFQRGQGLRDLFR